jgi:hypothetical protein
MKCNYYKSLLATWIILLSLLGFMITVCLSCGEYEELPPYNSFNGINGPTESPWNELDTVYIDSNSGEYQERYICRDLGSQYLCIPLEYHSIDNKGDIDPMP